MATTQLSVVNACLAIMGEAPINTLAEQHVYKTNALAILERNDDNLQSEGWWFNTETLRLTVNPVDSRMYPPTDAATVRPGVNDRWRYVQRGRVMYDLLKGTDILDAATVLDVQLVRRIAFDDLPKSVAAYVARKTVLDFQQDYDGDQTKTRNLQLEVYGQPGVSLGLKGIAEAEHIRNVGFNFIDNSERLSRITRRVNYSRRPY